VKVLLWLVACAAIGGTCIPADAQVITTVAGTDFAFPPTPIAASNAPTGTLAGVATDSQGNLYVADDSLGNNLIFKVDPHGVLTVVAGNGTLGYSGDGGPATSAAIDSPSGLAVDASGNLYFADGSSQRIRKVTPAGIISTVAGIGVVGYSGDGGLATNAALALNGYGTVAVDASGNLYISDQGNCRIRKVTTDGIITTVAGNGISGYSGDGGLAVNASIGINYNTYVGIAVDTAGNLFLADYGNHRIRKVTPDGIINTVAGTGARGFTGDGGLATNATMNYPSNVAVDRSGSIFIVDVDNIRIRQVNPAGIINTVAGNGIFGFSGDGGPAIDAALSLINGVAVDPSGNVFISDGVNYRVRKVTPSGGISTFVGNGKYRFVGDGGPASSAVLNFPAGISVDSLDNIFLADSFNNRIRKVTAAGTIDTFAGTGTGQFFGDGGPATQAGLLFPFSVAVDPSRNVFIADTQNDLIRKVVPSGIISTIAGNLLHGYSGDGGPGVTAMINLPVGVATDASGNVFIADNNNNRVRRVTTDGVITTVAGNGARTFAGDGGPAAKASLNLPTGVAVDAAGNLFINDSGNDRVRKVTPDGKIATVAGNGVFGYSGDGGPGINARLNLNSGASYDSLTADSAGNLYIADYFNNRIRKLTPGGIISTVAGSGSFGYAGDGGPATAASLEFPSAVAIDSAGNLLISDTFNNRIRAVLSTLPSVSVAPRQLQFTAPSGGAPSTPQNLSVTSPVEGLAFSASVSVGASWLHLNTTAGVSPRLIQVTADPTGLAPNTYQATINIGVPNATPSSIAIAVTFQVTAAMPSALALDKPSLSFAFPLHGTARSQTILVSNTGGGPLPFTAVAATASGGNWLSLTGANGQALPGAPATLTITANPASLSPGTYSGHVTVTSGGEARTVAVIMTISTLDQAILLSQSGLSFLAVQGGGVVPTQSFAVQNIGSGVVNWTASTSTLAGGSAWLHVTPATGSSNAAASVSPRVTVSVDGSSLPAGTYYGLVRVDAPGAANSPQVLTVFLQVLPPNAQVSGVVTPSHLVFTAVAGAEAPGSQTVQVYNIVAAAKSFSSYLSADAGVSLVTLPQNATLDPRQPTSIVVQPQTANLNPGIYNGFLSLQFSDGTVSDVQVTIIVAGSRLSNPSAAAGHLGPEASGTPCTPQKLFPVLTTLGQTFTVSAGWPTALVVTVKDDCGTPLAPNGSVTVNFSDGESPLALSSQGSGNWESTWPAGSQSQGVTLKIHAINAQGVAGDQDISGSLASQQQPPAFDKAGITNGAVVQAFTALAPGAAISIYGTRLAESSAQAATLPLPPQLVDTQVFIAGTTPAGTATLLNLPLYYVSENQINAMIPYEVSVNTSLQLLVQRGNTYSTPVQIDMAQAQPAVFGASLLPGSAGLILVYPANGSAPFLAGAGKPAHVGDTISLYCAGLGAVNPAVVDGAPPGSDLSHATITPQVTVGGQSAQVGFAGLAPGFAGLYQVNVVVPTGTQTGANVPISMITGGQTSPPITIAIQ
jgi:uncharacterized protein (TIGR03437 family)